MGCAVMLSVSAQAALTELGTFTPSAAPPPTEAARINTLLGLTLSTTQTISGITYTRNSTTDPGSGSVTTVGFSKIDSPTSAQLAVSGFEYVLGKYSNMSVVWHLGFGSGTLPASYGGHAISHLTQFTPVPEPSTYIAGALLLAPVFMQLRRSKRTA